MTERGVTRRGFLRWVGLVGWVVGSGVWSGSVGTPQESLKGGRRWVTLRGDRSRQVKWGTRRFLERARFRTAADAVRVCGRRRIEGEAIWG